MGPVYSTRNITKYEQSLDHDIAAFTEIVKTKSGNPLDLQHALELFAIGQLSFICGASMAYILKTR